MSDEITTIEVQSMKTLYAVYINTDLTEGRGSQYPRFICEKQSTATRLAKGADVQGCNGTVQPVNVFWYCRKWYGPIIGIEYPTDNDKKEELRLQELEKQKERYSQAVENAKQLGLTDEDLKVLQDRIQ
jgi:hypothetical protein